MMARERGLTLLEVVLALLVASAAVVLLAFAMGRRREEARVIRCRNHLNCLAKAMATYLNEHGGNRWYPCPLGLGAKANTYNGAEWLASLYWARIHPSPYCFICPSSGDTNHDGRDLGAHRAAPTFGSQTVSYAAMHYRSLTDDAGNPKAGALRDDFPPNEVMACDDTEGSVNHAGPYAGMAVLFFDSHVEFWAKKNRPIDIERGVGTKGGPLWRLRN